jgi:putative transposase
MEADIDHIHLMIQYIPRVSISAIVNRIKSITTKRVWNLHQNCLQKHFWKEKHFGLMDIFTESLLKQPLFATFVCSVGEASPETIANYIKNQG